MKKFSIYETITASILAASVVMAGCTMAGQGSAFNRASVNAPAEPLMITIGSVDIVTLTPTPTEAILLKESPIEMLGNEVIFGADAHPTGLMHGTVTLVRGGLAVEHTTERCDGAYRDSRHPDVGLVPTEDIIGSVVIRLTPFANFGKVN